MFDLMLRRILVALACCAAVSAAACSSGDDNGAEPATVSSTTPPSTVPIEQLQARADDLTDLLIAGTYRDVVDAFNAEMRAGLSAPGLKTAWEQVIATYGAYKSRGTTTRVHAGGGETNVVFDTPLTFGTNALKCRITFDSDGALAGLRILPASTA